jgi:hypothetical protein
MDYEDPGWKRAVKLSLVRATAVGLLWKRNRLSSAPTPLEAIRYIFIGLALSVWLILFALSFVGSSRVPDALIGWMLAVVAVGLLAAWRIRALDSRLVRVRGDRGLLATYRAGFFIGVGWAEFPALLAFVLSFVAGTLWVYVVGAVMSSIDLWLIAPTRRNIMRIQGRLDSGGSPVSLGRLLTEPVAGPDG